MPQISRRFLKDKTFKKIEELLWQVLSEIRQKEEAKSFCSSFFTPTERIMFAKRFAVFYLLQKGIEQKETAELLKMSTATISYVNVLMNNFNAEQRSIIKKILVKKEVINFFKETFLEFFRNYDSNVVPKGRSPKNWWKEKIEYETEKSNPLK